MSLGTTILAGAVFGALAVRAVEGYALSQHARMAATYVSEFLAPRLVAQDFLVRPPAQRVQFEFAMRGLVGRAGILRVTVWNPRGQVLYSDDRQLLGRTLPPPPSVRAALHGQIQSLMVSSSQGVRHESPGMEVFVPIVLRGAPDPVGVYDILFGLKNLTPTLDRLRWFVWASTILGVLMLYAALFAIVLRASRDLVHQHETLQQAFSGITQSLSRAVDVRDMATADHSDHVAELAMAITRAMGANPAGVREIQIAAYLHDVGKIGIHDDILVKHGALTKRERAAMQRHAVLGYRILQPVPISEQIKAAVRHHHEWWDGSGYPDGLAGEQIPMPARIIAVADVYTALIADRAYRAALDPGQAVEYIRRGAGSQFDPAVVAAFLRTSQASPSPAGSRGAAVSAAALDRGA